MKRNEDGTEGRDTPVLLLVWMYSPLEEIVAEIDARESREFLIDGACGGMLQFAHVSRYAQCRQIRITSPAVLPRCAAAPAHETEHPPASETGAHPADPARAHARPLCALSYPIACDPIACDPIAWRVWFLRARGRIEDAETGECDEG